MMIPWLLLSISLPLLRTHMVEKEPTQAMNAKVEVCLQLQWLSGRIDTASTWVVALEVGFSSSTYCHMRQRFERRWFSFLSTTTLVHVIEDYTKNYGVEHIHILQKPRQNHIFKSLSTLHDPSLQGDPPSIPWASWPPAHFKAPSNEAAGQRSHFSPKNNRIIT